MATFNVTSTVSVDGTTHTTNQRSVVAQSILDYTKEVGATYDPIVTASNQPTTCVNVWINNTGTETALVRATNAAATDYYFTALAPGCTMACYDRDELTAFTDFAVRSETGTTTLRIVALYI